MKQTLLALMMCLLAVPALSQGPRPAPRQGSHTVNFEARGGESFSVYVDGDLMNRMPQTRVLVDGLDGGRHEVVVVMNRPARKAAVMQLQPEGPSMKVDVLYDQRADALRLDSPVPGDRGTGHRPQQDGPHAQPAPQPAHQPAPQPAHQPQPAHHGQHGQPSQPAPQPAHQPAPQPAPAGVSADQLDGMVARMKSQSFDNDRLALGKVIVASSNLTATQITRLAETMEFSATQVDFLKYAYQYCIDPVNYYKTTDILTFSSDKKKVLDYIASQK